MISSPLVSMKRTAKVQTSEEYLSTVSPEKRAALKKLRRTIGAAFPRAEECISYGMPGFRVDGRVVAWFAAATNHCSFYPGGIPDGFESELADYETSKGTIRFQPDHPFPAGLVKGLIKGLIARSAAGAPRRRTRR